MCVCVCSYGHRKAGDSDESGSDSDGGEGKDQDGDKKGKKKGQKKGVQVKVEWTAHGPFVPNGILERTATSAKSWDMLAKRMTNYKKVGSYSTWLAKHLACEATWDLDGWTMHD